MLIRAGTSALNSSGATLTRGDKTVGIASLVLCLAGGHVDTFEYVLGSKSAASWGSLVSRMMAGLAVGKRWYVTRSSNEMK